MISPTKVPNQLLQLLLTFHLFHHTLLLLNVFVLSSLLLCYFLGLLSPPISSLVPITYFHLLIISLAFFLILR